MVRSIIQNGLHTHYRVSCQRTFQDGFLNTLFYCREVVLRNCAAEYLLLKYLRFFQIAGWLKDHLNVAVLAMSAGLLLIFALNLNFLS